MACQLCSQCCRFIVLHLSTFDYDLKYLEARGWTQKGMYALVYDICPHLSPANLCDLHNEGKPEFCKKYPKEGDVSFKLLGCKFYE